MSDLSMEPASNTTMSPNDSESIDKSLLSLKSCKEWLDQQKLDYDAELNTRKHMDQDELEVNAQTEEYIMGLIERVSSLQEELLEESSLRSVKKLVLERLLLSYAKMKELFTTDEQSIHEKPSKRQSFEKQCEEQTELNKEILKYHEALEEEQSTLRELQQKQAEVKRRNQELMEQLQELKDRREAGKAQRENQATVSLRKQIMEFQDMTTVVNSICQALVVGSNINWAADDDLREMVLNLGKPCDFLEESP